MELENDKLIYLRGFLDSISYLNTFDNDGKTYLIEFLDKINGDFQETLRKRFKVTNWIIKTELISSDWKQFIKKESRPYFDQIIGEVFKKTSKDLIYDSNGSYKENAIELIENIKQDSHFYVDHLLQEKFIESLGEIVTDKPKLYTVDVDWRSSDEGWYELYHTDFLFDLGDKVLFLHFGGSD